MIQTNKLLKFSKDGPIYKACLEPQLMLHRHMGFSSFYKNKQRNQRLHEDWIREVRGLQTRSR